MDFTQTVWVSIFTGENDDPAFANPRHFLSYLAGMAHNKVREEYRRQTLAQKNQISREEPLHLHHESDEDRHGLAGRDPTPSQEAQAADTLDRLMAGRTPQETQFVELRLQGLTFVEIAARAGVHERTVRKFIDRLRTEMEGQSWE